MSLDAFTKIATIIAGLGTFSASAYTILTASTAQSAGKASLAQEIADGQPWAMNADDGKKGTLILNPDGSGALKGMPIPVSPTWRATPGGICINLGFAGERCVTLRKIKGGYEGSREGRLEFRLSR